MKSLVRKLLNIKRDYIEIIPGSNSLKENKYNVNEFLNEVRLNKGKIGSIQTISYSETKWDYHTEFNAELKKKDYYSTGYEDKCDPYTEFSSCFIIHYRCYKELNIKDKLNK